MEKTKTRIFIFSLIIFMTGCENSENNGNNNSIGIFEVVTSNIMQSNYYYNLATKSEVQSDDIWHISAQLKQVDFGGQSYGMPCVVLGNVYAQLSDSTFNEVTVPPIQTSTWYQDNSAVEYGGTDEIISYNMTSHVASIENPGRTFIIYDYIGHTTYKIQFLEYTNGVVSLQFSAL
jgi:hypothetical protein